MSLLFSQVRTSGLESSSLSSNASPKPSDTTDLHCLADIVQRFYAAGLSESHKTYKEHSRMVLSCILQKLANRPELLWRIFCYFCGVPWSARLCPHNNSLIFASSIFFKDSGIQELIRCPTYDRFWEELKWKEVKQGWLLDPITPSILKKPWIEKDSLLQSVMLWAASQITFFSLCRLGEFTVKDKNTSHTLFILWQVP